MHSHEVTLSEDEVSHAIADYLRKQGKIPAGMGFIQVHYQIERYVHGKQVAVTAVLTEK